MDESVDFWTFSQALHHVCSRENAVKSVRVCQVVLQVIDLLLDNVEKDDEVALVLDSITKLVSKLNVYIEWEC